MKLIFIYNAEAGLIHGMMDSIHKTLSPATYACSLCAVTYGALSMKREWRDYLDSLPFEMVFHHRKDFMAAYPDADVTLPAVLLDRDGGLTCLIDSVALNKQDSLSALIDTLDGAIAGLN